MTAGMNEEQLAVWRALAKAASGGDLTEGSKGEAGGGGPMPTYTQATTLLKQPPFSSFKQSALVLVNSKVLSMEDIKAIGTEKRFGVGADVIIMLGGLADATERSDRGAGLDYASKAAASLDEIIAIGRSNGL